MLQQLFDALKAALTWWIVVTPWEQALRVRWGRHVTLLRSGVYLRLPIVDRVYRQTVRRRFSAVPTQTLTMQDGKTVTVAGSLGYCIVDLQTLYATLHHAEATLEAETQALVSDFIISHEYTDFTPAALQNYVEQHLDFSRYGIGDAEFVITTFVCVKTYRLLQGEPRDYTVGTTLDTISDADDMDEY